MTNTVLLVGNLGTDPETRTTRGDTRVTSLSLSSAPFVCIARRSSSCRVSASKALGFFLATTNLLTVEAPSAGDDGAVPRV
jgi:single-stranded DNA-binding protein